MAGKEQITPDIISYDKMLDLTSTCVLAKGCAVMAAAGVASHLVYFMHGDHNKFAHKWITRALTGIGSLVLALLYLTRFDLIQTAILTIAFAPSYFLGLYTSIAVYRLFLHPLRHLPGPFWARLSNFHHAYTIRKSDNYLVIEKLHQKYGPIVRTGGSPNTVTSVTGYTANLIM